MLAEENTLGQKFIVSATLRVDLRPTGKTDDLAFSVDYGEVCRDIRGFTEGNKFRLIETLAEGLCELILESYPEVKSVTLEVIKPWAPVFVHLEAVSVEITRMRHTAYLSLGSNIGEREAHLRFAIRELGQVRGCRVKQTSAMINTVPYGDQPQGDFLNACLELETLLTPDELWTAIDRIEQETGRKRMVRWGPRTLDIDIILFDDEVIRTGRLTIPHSDMHRREFVLRPLCEIAPDVLHPIFGKTVCELLVELCGDQES